jgi:predicted hydrocarbon binding protein
MKGILFNVVEDVVTEAMSADAWDDVVEAAGVDGSYTSLATYPDTELTAIAAAIATAANLSTEETLTLAGRLGFKHLAARNPHLLDGIDGWLQLVESLDSIIHPEVRKIYADAEVPGFATTQIEGGLRVVYTSRRQLCSLAEGLIVGGGEWFDCKLAVEHERCVRQGDTACTMVIREITSRDEPSRPTN